MAGQNPMDRHAALGRAEGRAARELADHQAGVAKLMVRIIALPVWLPFYIAGVMIDRRAMARFARERANFLNADGSEGRELALAWVAQQPERYPHGQYDSKFPKLERRFSRLARKHREDVR